MKILLFVPSIKFCKNGVSNPLGVLSIASTLKANGFEVKICDRNIGRISTHKVIEKFAPDVIGVSVISSFGIKDAVKISKISKSLGKLTVWGGPVPSGEPELCLKSGVADYVMLGEGEITWLEFVRKLQANESPDGIDGIAFLREGRLIKTARRAFVKLDDLPPIDWSLVDVGQYFRNAYGAKKALYLYSAKGCPFNCAFCSSCTFHCHEYRARGIDSVLDEIENLIKSYGVDGIIFSNELWCLNSENAREFCRKIKERKLDFIWTCDARVGQYSLEDFKIMADANCKSILFGVESGSESMLKRMNKQIDIARLKVDIRNCAEAGIEPCATFIIGAPDETEEELRDTCHLVMDLSTRMIPTFFFTPLAGSRFYDDLEASGRLTKPKTIFESASLLATEQLGVNYSEVPKIDLLVVRYFIHWLSFVKGKTNGDVSVAVQAIAGAFHTITTRGPLFFFVGAFGALREFIVTFYYAVMHPRIRKKYGLSLRDKK